MRRHAEGTRPVGTHVGDDRVPVASVAPEQAQLAVQVQSPARVLAVGPDRSDRDARQTTFAEKVIQP